MTTLYVNVYSVGRVYGGPEEGGWYYDVGTPIAATPVFLTDEEKVKCLDDFGGELQAEIDPDGWSARFRSHTRDKARKVADWWRELYPNTGARWSVLGGDDYNVTIEDHFPQPWPSEVPRYE